MLKLLRKFGCSDDSISNFVVWEEFLFVSCLNGHIYKFNKLSKLVHGWEAHPFCWIDAMCVYNNYLYSGDGNGNIAIWDQNGKCITRFTAHKSNIESLV